MLIKENISWLSSSLKKKKFNFILKNTKRKKLFFLSKKKLYLITYTKRIHKKYLLLIFKAKILNKFRFKFNHEKKKYEIFAENLCIKKINQINYNKFINFFCVRFSLFKWSLQFYIKYLFFFFKYIFVFNLNKKKFSLLNFKILHDLLFMLHFKTYTHTYLKYFWNYLSRFIDYRNDLTSINISTFLSEYLPIFDLNTQVTLCFIFRLRNLFLLTKFFNALQLFETTGLDYHHNNRQRKSAQIKCLSNLLWQLLVRDKVRDFIIFFLNLKHNSFDFLVYLTHLQYLKKFKNYPLKITQLNIRFREQYGFKKGRKLAIRKRFLRRKRIAEKFFFFKEKKKYL